MTLPHVFVVHILKLKYMIETKVRLVKSNNVGIQFIADYEPVSIFTDDKLG